MAKGGRATKLIINAMKVLKLKPIIELYHKNHMGGIGKKFENIVDNMCKKIKKM
jgi:fatty acid-binding protein DegV